VLGPRGPGRRPLAQVRQGDRRRGGEGGEAEGRLGAGDPAHARDYGGNAWFLSSPKGFNFFKTLHDRGNQAPKNEKRRDELDVVDLLLVRQPARAREEIDRIAAEMPELVRRQEILGQFVDLSGASVHREWVKYGEFPPLLPHTIAIGVDLAISLKDTAAYTAIVVLARLPMGASTCWR
jgi:hypothetical protein